MIRGVQFSTEVFLWGEFKFSGSEMAISQINSLTLLLLLRLFIVAYYSWIFRMAYITSNVTCQRKKGTILNSGRYKTDKYDRVPSEIYGW